MRQMVYEHPFAYPGRISSVCDPGLISWNVDPHLPRSGFLGVPPFCREPPRELYHPLPIYAFPAVNACQTLEPYSLDRSLLQMTWLKGTNRDRKLNYHRRRANRRFRKPKAFSKAACTKKTSIKKGLSQEDAPKNNVLEEKDVGMNTLLNLQEKLPSVDHNEALHLKVVADGEHQACALEMQVKGVIDDVEEGEIVSDFPEGDMNQASLEFVEQVRSGNVPNVNDEKSIAAVSLVDLSVQKQSVDNCEEREFVDMKTKNCKIIDSSFDRQVLLSLEVGFSNSKDSESESKTSSRLDEISSDAMMTPQLSHSSMSVQPLQTSSPHEIPGRCENSSDAKMSTEPKLFKNMHLTKPSQNREVCINSRDLRMSHKAISLLDQKGAQNICPIKESIAEKRKHVQVSFSDLSSKRCCIEKENDIHSMTKNQSNNDVLVQEPIDMEIDNLEPNVLLPKTDIANLFDNDEGNIDVQKSPTTKVLKIVDPSKLGLKPRDPRRVLVHQSDFHTGYAIGRDLSSLGRVSEHKETNQWDSDKRQESLESYVARNYEDSWANMHFEELADQEREAIRMERARRIDEQKQMLNSRKLCLVLDLDHTLLNSAKFSEVDENLKMILCRMETKGCRNANGQPLKKDLYWYPKLGIWTKLRPGVWDFLSRASELYELHVSTMGNRAYASEMTKLLDPTGTLFGGRVISRGDDSESTFNKEFLPKSKDLDGVLGLESAVIIIDDSVHVWPHHRNNLLVVERYMYFPFSRKQFGLSGPSLLERRHDERATDGMLASILKVIEKIHQDFFTNKWLHEVDVRHVLSTVKQTVLAGCKIVFSRVYPQGESQPHLHPLWQMAEQFGAVCTTIIDDDVTHVVATSRGTDKVKWAMRTGRFFVCPSWLEASAVLYRRASEVNFPVPS
ncbi:hypothetical protein L7F22_031281 [Adiantum nelumboides]|nr:hypothetical protein [Adiantum nelumboides]